MELIDIEIEYLGKIGKIWKFIWVGWNEGDVINETFEDCSVGIVSFFHYYNIFLFLAI